MALYHCWWVFERVRVAVHNHHRPHKWVGRGARHVHHHAGAAKVAKSLVCVLAAGGGAATGWVSVWGSSGGISTAPAPYYGETGPEWWSGGFVPSPFAAPGIGAEAFASPIPISAETVSPAQLGAEEVFGRVIAHGEEHPVEIGFFVPKTPGQQSPTIPSHPETGTGHVVEPSSLCVLLSAIGALFGMAKGCAR